MKNYIYHEQQESALCGQHCLNNLLQGPYFTAVDLSEIAAELDAQEVALGQQESLHASANVDDSGNFSIQVLRSALQRFNGVDLRVWFRGGGGNSSDEPSQQKAFIVNRSQHWLTIRKIHGRWWNLNSVNERPEVISDFYLTALLSQLRDDGFQVFIVDGDIPESNHPDKMLDIQASSITGQWFEEVDLLGGGGGRKAGADGEVTGGFRAFQGKSHRLGDGGSPTPQSSSTNPLSEDYDEEAALARAIAASLEPTPPPASSAAARKEELRAKRLAALSKQGFS